MDYEQLEKHSSKCGRIKNEVGKEKPGDETAQNIKKKKLKKENRNEKRKGRRKRINPLNAELNPICYLLALLGAHHFLHVSRIKVKILTFR